MSRIFELEKQRRKQKILRQRGTQTERQRFTKRCRGKGVKTEAQRDAEEET